MSEYKEQSISGVSWQRSYKVAIDNQLDNIPTIVFYEEEAVRLPSGAITKHVGQLVEKFTDPAHTYPLVNPLDGSVIGEANYQQIYVLLHSLYLHLADQRDNAVTSVR